MEGLALNLFSSLISIETKLSDVYMALASTSQEQDAVKAFDRSYYDSVEAKHSFIKLRKTVQIDNGIFSDGLLVDAEIIDRQLWNLTKNARNLEKRESYLGLIDLVYELENRLVKLYERICNQWENGEQSVSTVLAKRETRLVEMTKFKQVKEYREAV